MEKIPAVIVEHIISFKMCNFCNLDSNLINFENSCHKCKKCMCDNCKKCMSCNICDKLICNICVKYNCGSNCLICSVHFCNECVKFMHISMFNDNYDRYGPVYNYICIHCKILEDILCFKHVDKLRKVELN